MALPDNYHATQRRYTVLVILDADDTPQFGAAIANVKIPDEPRCRPVD